MEKTVCIFCYILTCGGLDNFCRSLSLCWLPYCLANRMPLLTLWLGEKVGISKGRWHSLFSHPLKILSFWKGEKMVLKLFLKGCGNIRKLFRNENQPSETASNSRMKIKWRRNYRKFEYSSKDCLVSFGNFQTISESSKWKGRIEKRPGTILNHI